MISKSRRYNKPGVHQTIFFSIFLGLLFLVAVCFLVFSNWKISQRRAEFRVQIEAFKKGIQVLEEKNAQLRAGISQTGKESYWEEKIRQERYKKPGEEQVVVLPPEKNKETKTETGKSFWQRFLEKIGF